MNDQLLLKLAWLTFAVLLIGTVALIWQQLS